jgi:cytochrome c-type biogenesis protein CcmH
MNRRAFLATALVAPVVMAARQASQDSSTTRALRDPDMAGRPRGAVTDYENDPFIVALEKRLKCSCPCGLDVYTCRTTDFTCTFSPAMHREVVALVEQGKTAQEILQAFVAQYGERALMAPAPKGFNWAGYLLPGTAIVLTGSVLSWTLMRRHRVASATPAPAPAPVDVLSPDERARLADELQRLEG